VTFCQHQIKCVPEVVMLANYRAGKAGLVVVGKNGPSVRTARGRYLHTNVTLLWSYLSVRCVLSSVARFQVVTK